MAREQQPREGEPARIHDADAGFAMMRDMLAALPALPEQRLLIANFPPHIVERLDGDWEWLIANDNVTLVSSGEDDVISYDGRHFQTPAQPQADAEQPQ